jgi:hypothetical protein
MLLNDVVVGGGGKAGVTEKNPARRRGAIQLFRIRDRSAKSYNGTPPGQSDGVWLAENSNVDCHILKRKPALPGEGSRYDECFFDEGRGLCPDWPALAAQKRIAPLCGDATAD